MYGELKHTGSESLVLGLFLGQNRGSSKGRGPDSYCEAHGQDN
jgi:hypothetical protein